MNYVVKNPAGLYLQDQGAFRTPEFPRGGPGYFGPRETAHVFATQVQAIEAKLTLIGPGRNSTLEPA